jgi:hypothetical protein
MYLRPTSSRQEGANSYVITEVVGKITWCEVDCVRGRRVLGVKG